MKKITLLCVLSGGLVGTSVAMSYYPQHSIPHEEIARFSELAQDMKLNEVYRTIDDSSHTVDSLTERSEILQTLVEPLNKVRDFCSKVEREDRMQKESSDILMQLQMTKMLVIKAFFDFYVKVKAKLGSNAEVIIKKSTFASSIFEIFGII